MVGSFYESLVLSHFEGRYIWCVQVAIEEGKNMGAKIVLGDQDIDITMKHLGEQMSMQDAFKFFGQPMPNDIAQQMSGEAPTADMFERLRDRKIVRRFSEEMEKGAPALTKVSQFSTFSHQFASNLQGRFFFVFQVTLSWR